MKKTTMESYRTQSSSFSSSKPLFLHLLITFLLCSSCFSAESQPLTSQKPIKPVHKPKIPAIFVFGDSTVDPGNNNFISTIFKSDFPPYGKDFKNQVPTGRFSNGRLTTDFIASYAGVKDNVPPYLDPSLGIEELMSGVSFASAGSGFDPLTPTINNVIDLPAQVEYFRECKRRIESEIGKKEMEKHIEKAAFFISAGTNDFVINYFILPIRRKSFTIEAYQQLVLQNLKLLLQTLWKEGARRIGVGGLPPMGCLPVVITLFSGDAFRQRGCIEKYSDVARGFNFFLQNELNRMQMSLARLGSKIYYMDTFTPVSHMIQDYRRFGFDEVSNGCCGTGYLEASILCNPKSYLCSNTSKYVFFDSIHPSEKTYYNVFLSSRPIIDMILS